MRRFLAEEIEFLVIGAQAMRAHGFDRATRDLDLLVEASAANAMKLADVLPAYLSAVTFQITADVLPLPDKLIRLPDQYMSEVDVLTSLAGIDFRAASRRRCFAQWGSLRLPFLAIEDLYESKRKSQNP